MVEELELSSGALVANKVVDHKVADEPNCSVKAPDNEAGVDVLRDPVT